MKITNEAGINLPLAVWLLSDDYDYVEGYDNYISATSLMKPLRQIILPGRIPPSETRADVADFIARKLGHAIHDSMEKAWSNPKQFSRSLIQLGYPVDVIERIAINPTDEERRASNSMIPVFLEQRAFREIDGFTIGGKFDMVAEGIVQDTKSSSAWSWAKGTRDDDHRIQMSLYRWIDAALPMPRIQEDFGIINYIFTDWSKAMLKTPNYPQKRVASKEIALLTLAETETWVHNKLALISKNYQTPENQLPHCTDEELWRSAPQYKYFSDPTKAKDPAARSTKNFDSASDARSFMASKGGIGIVVTKPGEVKACGYCPAFDACTQKDQYV